MLPVFALVCGLVLLVAALSYILNDRMRKRSLEQRIDAFTSNEALISELSGKKVLAICNPVGGNRTALKTLDEILKPMCKSLGIHLDIAVTTHAGHARSLAEAAKTSEHSLVICLSGDGMLHEVVQGVLSADKKMQVAVAVLPCGSSNGISKSLYSTVDRFEAARAILLGRLQTADLASVQTLGSSEVAGCDIMGVSHAVIMDANDLTEVTLRWMNRLPFGAELKSIVAAVFLIGRMKVHRVALKFRKESISDDDMKKSHYTDPAAGGNAHRRKLVKVQPPEGCKQGEWFEFEDDVVWCETTNVSHLSYDVQPSPGLSAASGFLDVIVSRGHSRFQLLCSFLKAEEGKHVEDAWFERYKIREMVIEGSVGSNFSMSGEKIPLEPGKAVHVKCLVGHAKLWY